MATPIRNYSKKSDSRLNEKSSGHQKYAEIQDQQIKPKTLFLSPQNKDILEKD